MDFDKIIGNIIETSLLSRQKKGKLSPQGLTKKNSKKTKKKRKNKIQTKSRRANRK